MRIIGDIHGNIQYYQSLLPSGGSSIQIGDLGFTYPIPFSLDHLFFKGNHDNYDLSHPNDLGDFGVVSDMFFVRGAWSIDAKYRTPGRTWWDREEMNVREMEACKEEYAKVKPHILLSHEGPFHLLPYVISDTDFALRMGFDTPYIQTRTNTLLDSLYEIHRPKFHIFGHYHYDFDRTFDGTRYMCLTADPNMFRKQQYFDL